MRSRKKLQEPVIDDITDLLEKEQWGIDNPEDKPHQTAADTGDQDENQAMDPGSPSYHGNQNVYQMESQSQGTDG